MNTLDQYYSTDLQTREVGRPRRNRHVSGAQGDLLTMSEMGKLFRVSTRTIQRWSELNLIPCVKVGRTVRYNLNEVYEYLNTTSVLKSVDVV